MTMMLSVIMVTGIFAGMKLEVRAAKNYSIDLSDPGSFMFALQNTYYSDDTLVFDGFSQPPAGDKYIYIVRWDYIYNSKRVGSSITTCGENLSNVSITIPNDSQYDYAKLDDYTPPTVSQGPIQVVEFVFANKPVLADTKLANAPVGAMLKLLCAPPSVIVKPDPTFK